MTKTPPLHSGFTSAANFMLAACVSFLLNAAGLYVMNYLVRGLGSIIMLVADGLLVIYLIWGRHYAFAAGIVVGLIALVVVAAVILIYALSGLRGLGGP